MKVKIGIENAEEGIKRNLWTQFESYFISSSDDSAIWMKLDLGREWMVFNM